MASYRGSEDLYTIVSAHYNLSDPISEEKKQSVSGKRSWDGAVSPSLEMDLEGPLSSKRMCSQREVHIWTERTRRKKMSYMLNTLLSLLPGVHRKVNTTRIINEAISYIKTLQDALKDLEARKLETEASAKTRSLTMIKLQNSLQISDIEVPLCVPVVSNAGVKILGSNVVGTHAFATISAPQQSGFLPRLFSILNANQLEIVDCSINAIGCNAVYALHVMSTSNDQQLIVKDFRCALYSIMTTHQE